VNAKSNIDILFLIKLEQPIRTDSGCGILNLEKRPNQCRTMSEITVVLKRSPELKESTCRAQCCTPGVRRRSFSKKLICLQN